MVVIFWEIFQAYTSTTIVNEFLMVRYINIMYLSCKNELFFKGEFQNNSKTNQPINQLIPY